MNIKYYPVLLILILYAGCKTAYKLQKTESNEYILSDSTNGAIDSSVYKMILPYKIKMEGTMSEVLAVSENAMEKGSLESTLGNFVADACMIEGTKVFYPADGRNADIAFFNNGGLRRSLPKGNITRGDIFELMPFENELVVLTTNGVGVKKIFNFIASKNGAPVSGVRFMIKNKQAIEIMIGDQALDTTKIYKVMTSDYLANGGDGFDFLPAMNSERVNLKVRDAILSYVIKEGKAGRIINAKKDGRISNAQ